jgi:hypothetical protein
MRLFSATDLKSLVDEHEAPCISIFMPTHRSGPEVQQGPIRLKNLLHEALERLMASGLRSSEAEELLSPVQDLQEHRSYWQRQREGLAIYRSPDHFADFRLPVTFEELVVVTDRFHLKPVLPLRSRGRSFYLLALSQAGINLYEASRHELAGLELESVPSSLDEALRFDDPERRLQFHTSTDSPGVERTAQFHGHGVGTNNADEDLLRYFHKVDQGLADRLAGETLPMVLVGVDYLLPLYREANSYPHLMAAQIARNPEDIPLERLKDEAWKLMEPYFLEERKDAMDRYGQYLSEGRASDDLREVVPASTFGRVETLFTRRGEQRWGIFDHETGKAFLHEERHPRDQDLLDFASVQTLLKGGGIYIAPPEEVPGGGVIAAVFRY